MAHVKYRDAAAETFWDDFYSLIVKELEALSRPERTAIAKRVLESLCADGKTVERIIILGQR